MPNLPRSEKKVIITSFQFQMLKKDRQYYEGYVDYGNGNYTYVVTRPSYCALSNKSQTEFSILKLNDYQEFPLKKIKSVGAWVWRSDKKYLFFDRDVLASQKAVNQKYGGWVNYMPKGSVMKTEDSAGGGSGASYRVFAGDDGRGYVIDQDGVRYSAEQRIVTSTGVTIFGTTDDQLDAGTLHRNILSMVYVGPNNPKKYGAPGSRPKDRDDDYTFKPENLSDASAFPHDLDFNALGAEGAIDAFFNTSTIRADVKLRLRAAGSIPIAWRNAKFSDIRATTRDVVCLSGIVVFTLVTTTTKTVKQGVYDPFENLFQKGQKHIEDLLEKLKQDRNKTEKWS